MSRAVWSELVPYDTLLGPEVRRCLAARGLGVHVAVTPPQLDGIARVVSTLVDDGLDVAVWPMLDHADGRWPSAYNGERFDAFVTEVLRRLSTYPRSIALDFEPPIDELPGLIRLDPRALLGRWRRRGLAARATTHFASLCTELHARGLETMAITFPFALEDDRRSGWQRLFGTPLAGLPCHRFNAMLYSTMFEGYTRGLLDRADARGLLAWWSRRMHERYAEQASVSLGCVGPGILGDEPIYREPRELADDVAVARAAGIHHLVLFSLGGVLGRPPAEAWLDALVDTPAAPTATSLTPKGRVVISGLRTAARGLGWIGAMRVALDPSRRMSG